MLATLLLTMMMALGVATGKVSSNVYKGGNAFNTELENKPQIKKSPESVNQTYSYERVTTIQDTTYNNIQNRKYYVKKGNNNAAATDDTPYYNIYSTTYEIQKWTTYQQTRYVHTFILISFIKITPYWNTTNVNIVLNQQVMILNGNLQNSSEWIKRIDNYITTSNIDEYIDMTLTIGAVEQIYNYWSSNTNKQNNEYNQTYPAPSTTITTNEDNDYTLNPLTQDTSINVVLSIAYLQINSDGPDRQLGSIEPRSLTINTNALIPDVNYEVIDIPGVMFKILVMPFSFISTAFNLTIFPGTPYQLNFGNLFLTILAIFILMWLIKKVFNR